MALHRLPQILLLALVLIFAAQVSTGHAEEAKGSVGWRAAGANPDAYDMGIDSTVTRTGKRAGFIRSKEGTTTGWGTWAQMFEAKPYLGKGLRFSAYVRTEGVDQQAALWMRVDGDSGPLAFDNMRDRPIRGTTGWTQYEIVLDVPSHSKAISLGVMLSGPGVLWIDDCALTEAPSKPELPTSGRIVGLVKDEADRPLAGALVAVVAPTGAGPMATVRSGDDGRFELTEIPTGVYGMTATFPGREAAYLDSVSVAVGETAEAVELTLKQGGVTLHGVIQGPGHAPLTGVLIEASRFSDMIGDVFCTPAGNDGEYTLTLPAGYKYLLSVQSEDYEILRQTVQADGDQVVDLVATPIAEGPAPEPVVAWLKKTAIPLQGVEANHGFTDMEPLRRVVGNAHLVCLGEATHGTREFFQLKHRMLEFLATQMGFTVFGIEATFPESFDVNRYVLTGEGDPAKALSNLHFWTWNTEEVLGMIRWMREYNQDPSNVKKLKFYGFDMQFPRNAAKVALEYLRRVDPVLVDSMATDLQPFQYDAERLKSIPEEGWDAPQAALRRLVATFDKNKDEYCKQSSREEWEIARQHARVLQQYGESMALEAAGSPDLRDQYMAENIQWILRHEGPDTRMVAWAHNGHVSTGEDQRGGLRPMGSYLRQALGSDMVVFGFAFNEGSFRAVDAQNERTGLHPFTVGPAPEGSLDQTLARMGMPIAAVDLRAVPTKGVVADWFTHTHKMREIGATYDPTSERRYLSNVLITQDFDALLFVEKTSAALPTRSPDRKVGYSAYPQNLDFESVDR